VPTKEIALKIHDAIKAERGMATTARQMNRVLDTTPFAEPVIAKNIPAFTLATSELQFETKKDGVLPRSIMVVGKHTYAFKEFMKEQFPEIRYTDLIFNGGTLTKAAWVLPASAETEENGTLADFLSSLGATVTEVDLDGEDDEDDDDERDGEDLIDGEAEEASDDDEEEEDSDED